MPELGDPRALQQSLAAGATVWCEQRATLCSGQSQTTALRIQKELGPEVRTLI